MDQYERKVSEEWDLTRIEAENQLRGMGWVVENDLL